jgi:hypothetical protein
VTPAQINAARLALGLSYSKFAAALGYCGSTDSNKGNGVRLCKGERNMTARSGETLSVLLDGHKMGIKMVISMVEGFDCTDGYLDVKRDDLIAALRALLYAHERKDSK